MTMTPRAHVRALELEHDARNAPSQVTAAANAIADLLAAFGLPDDEHTARTPERAAKAWAHALGGYASDPREHLAVTFPVEGDPGVVIVHGIRVHSTCAHHLLPITGTATVAYRPNARGGRVVGLSKLARVLDGYARRLQVQEQLGAQVATALQEALGAEGAACIITADHGCMTRRGVAQDGASTTTYAFTGAWADYANAERAAVIAQHRGG